MRRVERKEHREEDENEENCCRNVRFGRLTPNFEDGDTVRSISRGMQSWTKTSLPSRSGYYGFQVGRAVHHDDAENEGGYEPNDDSAHQSPRYNNSSIFAFFSQVYRAVDTCVHVVW